ncbi:hypothetical protein AB0C84_35790 [Actinomadura sp. NPDC048955]|uniref:hypothetical protein n=1 Tax=Actinomadura sp. NPDC048955 TaxID=3158228 RepID=UPI0034035573
MGGGGLPGPAGGAEPLELAADAVAIRIGECLRLLDQLVEAMWQAHAAGVHTRAISQTTGFALRETSRYIAPRWGWDTIGAALADLAAEHGGVPPAELGHFDMLLWIRNVNRTQDVHDRLQALLGATRWRIKPGYGHPQHWGQWVPLIRLPDLKDTEPGRP